MENIKSETTGQKRIDTIATDIKKLVSGISNGKPAKVTEENMDRFLKNCLLYTSPSPRDLSTSRMPSSA